MPPSGAVDMMVSGALSATLNVSAGIQPQFAIGALSISADGKARHQDVITAMDAAGKLGFSHLRMTTVEAQAAP